MLEETILIYTTTFSIYTLYLDFPCMSSPRQYPYTLLQDAHLEKHSLHQVDEVAY